MTLQWDESSDDVRRSARWRGFALKAVVTGGAGFIGSHLVDRLLDEGYSVTVVDNMSCGRMDNLRQHSGNSRLAVEEVDIREADELKRVFAGHDVVFHLAVHA